LSGTPGSWESALSAATTWDEEEDTTEA
jgi:hypothetical protein